MYVIKSIISDYVIRFFPSITGCWLGRHRTPCVVARWPGGVLHEKNHQIHHNFGTDGAISALYGSKFVENDDEKYISKKAEQFFKQSANLFLFFTFQVLKSHYIRNNFVFTRYMHEKIYWNTTGLPFVSHDAPNHPDINRKLFAGKFQNGDNYPLGVFQISDVKISPEAGAALFQNFSHLRRAELSYFSL